MTGMTRPRSDLIEHLEPRRLMSGTDAAAVAPVPLGEAIVDTTPPRIVSIRLVDGPFQVRGVRVTFSEALLPARAERNGSYILGGQFSVDERPVNGGVSFGDGDEDLDDIAEHDRPRGQHLPIRNVTYDPATFSVTIFPEHTFLLGHLRTLRVRSGPEGVHDLAGNPLDGNNDGQPGPQAAMNVINNFKKRFRYTDADGDVVRLKVTGGGKVSVWRQLTPQSRGRDGQRPGDAAQILLVGPVTARTTLTGTVTPGPRGGDGHTTIGLISRAGDAQLDLLADPAFNVLGTET